MIRSYFKIAFRNLWGNKGFSAINILGLAIGIATCLIIMLFVQNELGYDGFNKKADRIVRISFQGSAAGETFDESTVMPPVAQTMKSDFPEVQEATRIRDFGTPKLVYGDKSFKEDAFAFVDSNFFQVFTLPLIEGDAKTALTEPNTIVITRALAKKYFGKENPMGKVISFKDGKNAACKVTGVIEKVPVNSHFHFEGFASMASLPESREPTWMSSNFYTYLVLPDGYDYKKLEAKFPQVVEKYIGPQLFQAMHVTLAEFRKKGNNLSFHLQPLTDIHLHSNFANDLSPAGDIRYVYIFSAIALFMLLIACINFMNLSTAGASKRAREVGIRKVLGSLKMELVRQFLLESILITAIALVLAMLLMYLALPVFNTLAGQTLSLRFADHPLLLPGLIVFVLISGILAGSYPAFYLSSFKPVAVLKGKFTSGKKSIGLRSGLVVFQFFISIVLIVSTTVVYKQLSYIQHKKLGYDKDQVLVLSNSWMLGKNEEVFRQQLQSDPRVASISRSGYLPAGPSDNNNFFVYPGENANQMVKTLRYDVDENYIPTLGISMLTGRNFSKDFASDSSGVILNETAAKAFDWGEKAPGNTISTTKNNGEIVRLHVIGIVKDFHFRSLHERISPLVMVLSPNAGTMIVKLKTKDVAGLLTILKKNWDSMGAEEPLSFSFLDERFNNTYKSEERIGLILGIFAGLTIFVACLGLFGLAKFTAEQRTKEIGIRKVLGATVAGVAALLSKDFLRLVLFAFVFASPIAWYIMDKWLQDFAYRISISPWVFAIAALLAVMITILTVSFQAIKAAIANPVNSLRSE
ncbi:MAG: FtsX-like permease family protein [Ferruginibacter sp.]|nr:FtsX-like permease family protein [Ferruginibacter sp.]